MVVFIFTAVLSVFMLNACKKEPGVRSPAEDEFYLRQNRIAAARSVLESRFPKSRYNNGCVNGDINGWVFFSIVAKDDGSRTDFCPHHEYAVVRDNGTIVAGTQAEKLAELGKIFKSMQLIENYTNLPAQDIAEITLCLAGRDVLVDEDAAERLSEMKGRPVSAPEVRLHRNGLQISFASVYYGMAVDEPVRYVIEVEADYTVKAANQ